jgi:glycerophosphoryl diester phosphodiesterase
VAPIGLAHRGDWSRAPENTLAAFAAAERAGADMIELDVRRTRDGVAVVLHDRTLERVWSVPRAVGDLTVEEVQAIGTGRDDGRIPTLREALESSALPVMVDFVDTDVVEPALAEVRRAGAVERVLFAGGNVEGHRLLRSLEPEARIALTWNQSTRPSDALLAELDVEYFNPPWELVDDGVVADMHDRGLLVSAWTVDDPATMRMLLDLGVDAVTTNRIGDLVPLLAERRAAAC